MIVVQRSDSKHRPSAATVLCSVFPPHTNPSLFKAFPDRQFSSPPRPIANDASPTSIRLLMPGRDGSSPALSVHPSPIQRPCVERRLSPTRLYPKS